jgi:hypothetical protein
VLNFKELGWSFFFWFKFNNIKYSGPVEIHRMRKLGQLNKDVSHIDEIITSVFNSDPRWCFCKVQNLLFRWELETYGFNPKKGPTLKPNSLKLGTCQGRNYFTLAHQTLFKRVWPSLESRYCMNKWVHL